MIAFVSVCVLFVCMCFCLRLLCVFVMCYCVCVLLRAFVIYIYRYVSMRGVVFVFLWVFFGLRFCVLRFVVGCVLLLCSLCVLLFPLRV